MGRAFFRCNYSALQPLTRKVESICSCHRPLMRLILTQSHEAGNRAEYTGMWEMGKKDFLGPGSGPESGSVSVLSRTTYRPTGGETIQQD